ncbi:MAG TPA: DUF1573 domain-containing protein [Pirellulales bacterium]|nr:DUF1573 domain-containing protein [Pirellulales bacterium]
MTYGILALVVLALSAGYGRYRFGSLGATAAYLAGHRVFVPDRVRALTNLTPGSEVLLTYTLTNLAGRPVTVLGAQTSCGCVAIDHLPTTLAEGEATPIHVRLKVSSDEPRIGGQIVLFTDFEGQPTIPLGFNGIVEDARIEHGG